MCRCSLCSLFAMISAVLYIIYFEVIATRLVHEIVCCGATLMGGNAVGVAVGCAFLGRYRNFGGVRRINWVLG